VLGGGFPGTSKTWRFMRDMINEVHDLAVALGGETCIVKGCEVNNGVVADGILIVNGEALPFQGGALGANVEIVEAVEQVAYFNDAEGDGIADVNDAYFERYARFGVAGTPWSDFKRITPLNEVARRLPPLQSALPFWGAVNEIPDGWQLCDGTNATPNLRGMFIAGYDPADTDHNAIGKTGGSSKVVLTDAEMPTHNHTGSIYIFGHKHSLPKTVYSKDGATGDSNTFTNKDNTGSVNVTETSMSPGKSSNFTTAQSGQNDSHENRPKFYTMAWIAYVG